MEGYRTCDSGPLDGSSFRELLDALRGIGGAHCATHLLAAVNATSLPTQPLLAADGVSQNPFSQLLKLPPQQDLASWQRSVRVAQGLSWEAVHTGPWRDVHVAWRDSYSVCGLLMAAQQVSENGLSAAMRTLDMAVLMGGPRFRPQLDSSIRHLTHLLRGGDPDPGTDSNKKEEDGESSGIRKRGRDEEDANRCGWGGGGGEGVILPPGASASLTIERILLPTLEDFLCDVLLPAVPTILVGAIEHWAARDRWRDRTYLKKVGGARTVPVEVGTNYLDPEWSQELMPLGTFLDCHVSADSGSSGGVRYLAQHPLFDQIPELAGDICVPDYCSVGGGEMVGVNAWIGPVGTVTPLHHDPHHNLLAQVLGQKYVRIYAADAGKGMYAQEETMVQNSSQVDLDSPDPLRFPLFSNLPYWDCTLGEGEMLYIPPKFWHYVRSLSPSASVSFWWRVEEEEGGEEAAE